MKAARARFASIAALADVDIDVTRAALVIAQEEYPALDVESYVKRIDALAAAARGRVPERGPVADRMARLTEFLWRDEGFVGNERSYCDPRNSFLNEVIDRRTGLPITLSIIFCAVGRRLGLAVGGVGFPGHYLVKHLGDPEIIADPFFGKLVTVGECAARLRAAYGAKAEFDHSLLRLASTRDTLVRMLTNLWRFYLENGDAIRALGCIDRILLLTPDAAAVLRERGLLYRRLECFGMALSDLEQYLKLVPDGEDAAVVRAMMPDLQRAVAFVQ